MRLQFLRIICSEPGRIFFILVLAHRVSNCFEISSEDIKHYDIILSSTKDNEIKEPWLGDNQLSLLPLRNLSGSLQLISWDTGLKTYGHVIFCTFPTTRFDLFSDLVQVQQFLKNKLIWKPHIFIRIPEGLPTYSADSFQNFAANLSLNLPIDSDVYLTFDSKSSGAPGMLEIYSIRNRTMVQDLGNLIYKKVDGSLSFNSVLDKSPRRSNFLKVPIKAVAMDTLGYELASDFDDDNTTTRLVGGFEVEQYWYLRDALNFSESAIKGTGFVREGPRGTLTGMAVSINSEEAEICISATEFLEYRASGPDGFSYLHPTFQAQMLAFFKQPPASSIRDVFISSFALDLWFMLFGLWLIIIGAMNLAYRVYLKRFDKIEETDVKMSEEISIWAVGAVCQQGWYFTPKAVGARIIFFFGWFTGSLCYTAFSASLVSILAVEVLPIHSFADLLKEKFYIYNDGHIPTTKYFVKGLQDRGLIPVVPETLRNVDIEDTVGKLPKSRSTMITLSDSFYPILEREGYSDDFACNVLSVVTVGTRPVKMSMFVKRSSPLREIFNNKIILMTERGVKTRLMQHYLLETSVQCLQGSSGFHAPLSSKDVFTAYVIILVGFSLSFSLWVGEKIFQRIWNRNSKNDVILLNIGLGFTLNGSVVGIEKRSRVSS